MGCCLSKKELAERQTEIEMMPEGKEKEAAMLSLAEEAEKERKAYLAEVERQFRFSSFGTDFL